MGLFSRKVVVEAEKWLLDSIREEGGYSMDKLRAMNESTLRHLRRVGPYDTEYTRGHQRCLSEGQHVLHEVERAARAGHKVFLKPK